MGSSTDQTLDKTRPKQFRGMAEGRRVHFAFGRAQIDLRERGLAETLILIGRRGGRAEKTGGITH
jgi:hypothetical protein